MWRPRWGPHGLPYAPDRARQRGAVTRYRRERAYENWFRQFVEREKRAPNADEVREASAKIRAEVLPYSKD